MIDFGYWLIVAEDLTDLLLFYFLPVVIFVDFCLCTVRGGKDHVVDEFIYSFAVGVIEYLADHTLEERFVLELYYFFVLEFGFSFGAVGAELVIVS